MTPPRGGSLIRRIIPCGKAVPTLRALTLFALLALPAASALAQVSPNQYEMMRQYGLDCSHRYDGCGGGGSYQGTVIHIPNQKWINYHGALAWSHSGGSGISENARSERAARREALRKCGARDCEIAAYVRNGCLAAAYDGYTNAVGAFSTREGAEQRAMKHCQAAGRTTCRITYSHCNLPVRIK